MQRPAFIVPGHDLDGVKEQKDKTGQPGDGKEKIVGGSADIPRDKIEKEQTAGHPGHGKEDETDQGVAPEAIKDNETGQGLDAAYRTQRAKHGIPPS